MMPDKRSQFIPSGKNFWGWHMQKAVGRSRHYFKIFDPVIEFVVVYMMNNFFRIKKSSEMFFHHKTMFSSIFSVWLPEKSVPIGGNPSSMPVWVIFPLKVFTSIQIPTNLRAIIKMLFEPVWVSIYGFFTIGTFGYQHKHNDIPLLGVCP